MQSGLGLFEMGVLSREHDETVVIFRHIDSHILLESRKSCKARPMTSFALSGKLSHFLFGLRHRDPFQGLVDNASVSDYLQTSPQAWRN